MTMFNLQTQKLQHQYDSDNGFAYDGSPNHISTLVTAE